jgi:hypothetical protein
VGGTLSIVISKYTNLTKQNANLRGLNVSVRKLFLFLILSMGTILTYYNVDKYIESGEHCLIGLSFPSLDGRGLRGG